MSFFGVEKVESDFVTKYWPTIALSGKDIDLKFTASILLPRGYDHTYVAKVTFQVLEEPAGRVRGAIPASEFEVTGVRVSSAMKWVASVPSYKFPPLSPRPAVRVYAVGNDGKVSEAAEIEVGIACSS